MENNTVQIVLIVVNILTLIALIVYVVDTRRMAVATQKSAEVSEKALEELRDARDQEVAPYIVAYFDVPNDEPRQLYLIVENTGRSMATDVKISFDPQLETPYKDLLARVIPEKGIPSLPPGYKRKTILDYFRKYKEYAPMIYDVKIEYFGGISHKLRKVEYVLDLWYFRGNVYPEELN